MNSDISELTSLDLKVYKLQATGNDFVFIDARESLPGKFATTPRVELARKLCHRNFGVGADGLVFVEASTATASGNMQFKWDFYNNDGSKAEMCGNATRCMGRWAKSILRTSAFSFETSVGMVRTNFESGSDEISSALEFVNVQLRPLEFEVAGKKHEALLVNTGVPHAVVTVPAIERVRKDSDEIRMLRFHPQTGERGANVTFVEIINEGSFRTITFERGVEGFTLSCGTGVIAAAAVGLRKTGGSQARISTPGGELTVQFGKDNRGVVLTGPSELVFETKVNERILE